MEAAFERLVDRYLSMMVEDHPVFATFLGIHSRDDELGDFSAEALDDKTRRARELLEALDAIPLDAATTDAQVDADALRAALRRSIFEHDELRTHEVQPGMYIRTALSGCHLLVVRDYASIAERARSLLGRLKQIPDVLSCCERNVKDPPPVFARVGAEVAAGGIAFLNSVIPGVIAQVPTLARDLEEASGAASEAFDRASSHFMRVEAESEAPFHIGRRNYEWLLKEAHLLTFDSDELLAIGREALAATKDAMAGVASRIDPNRDWREIIEELKKDHPTKGNLRTYYASEMARARDFVKEKNLVTIPEGESLEVIDTPVFVRAVLPYAAYMPPGPFEKQQGFFYVTPIDESLAPEEQERQLRGHPTHTITVIALHEGYPGHHLQLVRANAVPSKARKLAWSNVFIEGWALYCEEMMREAGFYPDPEAHLCQLRETLWRAARVVVDVGLSRGEMSIDEAIDLMVDEVGLERINATAEVKRYTANPTQPSSYLVGKRAIMDIRARYESAKGGAFDLKLFHDALLDVGSVPPALAEKALGLDGRPA